MGKLTDLISWNLAGMTLCLLLQGYCFCSLKRSPKLVICRCPLTMKLRWRDAGKSVRNTPSSVPKQGSIGAGSSKHKCLSSVLIKLSSCGYPMSTLDQGVSKTFWWIHLFKRGVSQYYNRTTLYITQWAVCIVWFWTIALIKELN